MDDATSERTLRKGWTTGACAAAAAAAAFRALAGGGDSDSVSIVLPRGERPEFPLSRSESSKGGATAGVIKDAGDDPDVTDGAEIVVTVEPAAAGSGIGFRRGEGVGTITRPGLSLAVGEPAINPGPRRIIADAIGAIAAELGVAADITVTVSIPGGEKLAARTLNGRLGIVGGLSVLGTTGVVVPYSRASWIHTIHRGIDVARASGIDHIAAATGKTSEAAARALFDLPEIALVEMGDFAGGLLKYLRRKPVGRLTIAGGFAKTCKLAQGHLYLHSSRSRVDFDALAGLAAELEADAATVERARTANTAAQVLEEVPELATAIARRAREVALDALAGETVVAVAVFDRGGKLVGHAGD
jgi:cobalt-precorrin-5B (C1)-methyltransferase